MEIENSHWLLVYTKAREEKRANKNLQNQGFETYLPMIAYEKMNQSKSFSLETMFPRYLFIKINLENDSWTRVKSTRGVSHLIIFGHKLASVPNEVMVFLRKRTDENDIFRQKITRREFQKGEKVIIKNGMLKGQEATLSSKKSKERVTILLRLMNQLTTAEIPASYIGQKEIIETLKL